MIGKMDRYADLIDRVYDQYGISRMFPVPLLSISVALGYEVKYFEINATTEELSAVTFYQKKQIFISPNESGGRFRFTLAHELGHILLGHGHDRESGTRIKRVENMRQMSLLPSC